MIVHVARVSGRTVSALDAAVVRGWALGRPAVLVLGDPSFAKAIGDLAPTRILEQATRSDVAELLSTLEPGTLIVHAGSARVSVMREILAHSPFPVTVLWPSYARRYRHHRIEKHAVPTRTFSSWAVFEVPAATRTDEITR